MTLTRRQVIALLLGAAGAPAIAPADGAELLELKVGDVITVAHFPVGWTVTAVFDMKPNVLYKLRANGVYMQGIDPEPPRVIYGQDLIDSQSRPTIIKRPR